VAIRSFRHAGLAEFFRTGRKAGIQPAHAVRLRRILTLLDGAQTAHDAAAPGFDLHPLKGDQAGRWAVRVSGNWRVTFAVTAEKEISDVNYEDYH
jgi:proteic killer suppression protein